MLCWWCAEWNVKYKCNEGSQEIKLGVILDRECSFVPWNGYVLWQIWSSSKTCLQVQHHRTATFWSPEGRWRETRFIRLLWNVPYRIPHIQIWPCYRIQPFSYISVNHSSSHILPDVLLLSTLKYDSFISEFLIEILDPSQDNIY